MSVNRFPDIFRAAAKLKDGNSFRDEFRGAEADNLRSQQSVCLWVGQDFCKPVALIVGQRPTVGGTERKVGVPGYRCKLLIILEKKSGMPGRGFEPRH